MMRRAADKAVFLFLSSQYSGFPKLVILRQLTGMENFYAKKMIEILVFS